MATSATTTASQPTRLLPNSHREPRMLSAVACASPATIRDSSTIAENIPNTARTRYSSPVARARRWIGRSLPGGSSLVDSGRASWGSRRAWAVLMSSPLDVAARSARAASGSGLPGAAEQGAGPVCRRPARRRGGRRLPPHAQARRDPRRGGDVAVPLRHRQGRDPRRHGRPRLRRDRAAVAGGRLEGDHAPASHLGPRRPRPPPVGDRRAGVARQPEVSGGGGVFHRVRRPRTISR
jgi:hypothetical protein